ncbi:MAG TPA: hypothetical protein VGJ05_08820 [Fimbriiglobus sp.]
MMTHDTDTDTGATTAAACFRSGDAYVAARRGEMACADHADLSARATAAYRRGWALVAGDLAAGRDTGHRPGHPLGWPHDATPGPAAMRAYAARNLGADAAG